MAASEINAIGAIGLQTRLVSENGQTAHGA